MKRKTARALRYPAFIVSGFVVGMLLLAGAFYEAGGGHGSYNLWAVASCPGLVFGLRTSSLIALLVFPVVQWMFIGWAMAEVILEKNERWSYWIMGVGATSIAAAIFDYHTLRSMANYRTIVADAATAGIVTGVVLIVVGVVLKFTVRANRKRSSW